MSKQSSALFSSGLYRLASAQRSHSVLGQDNSYQLHIQLSMVVCDGRCGHSTEVRQHRAWLAAQTQNWPLFYTRGGGSVSAPAGAGQQGLGGKTASCHLALWDRST